MSLNGLTLTTKWMLAISLLGSSLLYKAPAASISFNQDIRPLLSDNCFKCHGPDSAERKAGLRLDTPEGARKDLGGYVAIEPGKPDKSELILRITTEDEDDVMPPVESGKKLNAEQVALLKRWIEEGAQYDRHWSYVPPARPDIPTVKQGSWPENPIDFFTLSRMEEAGLKPSPAAERHAIIRRAALDLTGLPPTMAEVGSFMSDTEPGAYGRLVDRLLMKSAFGEHWARMWLDQARYADSAGYADDPPRTIWGFRDYVIRSFNDNKPFDQFTIEQIAGDMLEDPSEEELVATAFHRNTLTNNEGGTNDEEYRNVAIVDRVNTTMAAWMGTTMNCAQCHDHKYDPISQEEYFRMFAIFNNTEDADRRNESPLISLFSDQQKYQRQSWTAEIASLEKTVSTLTPQLKAEQAAWEQDYASPLPWATLQATDLGTQKGNPLSQDKDGVIRAGRWDKTAVYSIGKTLETDVTLSGLRLEVLPDDSLPGKGPGHGDGNFVLSRVRAKVTPPEGSVPAARFVRIQIPGSKKILSLAEVQVFSGDNNIALKGKASQSSTDFGGPPEYAIDNNTNGDFNIKSTTHTAISDNPWWEVDLKSAQAIHRIVLWNRTDGEVRNRLSHFQITLLDDARQTVWEQSVKDYPNPSATFSPSGEREVRFAAAVASFTQDGLSASSVLEGKDTENTGWGIAPQVGKSHTLTLVASDNTTLKSGSRLTVTLEHVSKHEYATLGKFRLATTDDPRALLLSRTPSAVVAALRVPSADRSDAQRKQIADHFLSIAPSLKSSRDRLATLRKQLKDLKPVTTVPVMRQLAKDKQRTTRIQRRGNFLDVGKEVSEGLPSVFRDATGGGADRLMLARWLVDKENPLTSRVVVNRFWEAIFGIGIVRTSEEFGSQGELPSHPALLDWLATELVDSGWDIKHLLRLMVTSATYRQSSRVTPEIMARDPDNRLLTHGPRFRLSAEMIRDQAMFVSGLLSPKMYGPPVRPLQPQLGVNAAFGSAIDWKTSSGEDRFRRGLYTQWRRSNPYPSMAAFDAPNREVCTVRRERTNTPLQALVTLNDPVYVEAAQALGRRMATAGKSPADRARYGFKLCLSRPPTEKELSALTGLYEKTYARFATDNEDAKMLATDPIGPAPEGANLADLAAWTVVGNVLLNLDEMLMKR